MSTSQSPIDNTTVPPADTGSSAAPPGSSTGTTERAPTNIANTTPLPTPTTQPGETLINSNIVGHELGAITHPRIGDGGVANSYANTTGSVELLSVGIDKQFYGKLTYEVFDFYGEGAPVNPTNVFSGETSVVNWDESSRTGVIRINTTIPCKADTSNDDGSMDLFLIIKDSLRQPLYYNINVPAATNGAGDTTPANGIVTTTTPGPPTTTTSTTPGPVDTIQITKSEFDTILNDTKSNRVVIRGEGKPLGPNEFPLTVKGEDVNIKINYNDELSVSKEGFNELVTGDALIAVERTILESIREVKTGRYRGGTYVVYVAKTLPGTTTTTGSPGVTTTTQSGGINVYAGTSTTTLTPEPPTTYTTTPEPPTTYTTTSTSVAPLGTIDRGGGNNTSGRVEAMTSKTPNYSPVVRFPYVSTSPPRPPGGGSTLSPEDQETLDDLLNRARLPGGCPSGWVRNASTGECERIADPRRVQGGDDDSGTSSTPPPTNQVGSQKELLNALQTFSNIYIVQDFTVSDIINVPGGVTIAGLQKEGKRSPTITMSNTLVAFKITSSNVTLRDFTIQSAGDGRQSKGIGVLVTRLSPDSLVSVSDVTISNITFRDIGAIKKTNHGSISVRGYNATQSSPKTGELIPVLDDNAEPFSNITIDNCTFNNAASTAIDLWTVKNSKISNCTVNGTDGDGIRGVDLQGTEISDCYLKDISQIGIRILGPKSSNVALNSNAIDSCDGIAGIMMYYGVHGATVRNNRISNSNNGFLIRSACTSITLDNNNTDRIKEAPLIISELNNNIEVVNNTFTNTFGSTVITILQSWGVDLENNVIDAHSFEIGPGTAPKRGILISQSNKVSLTDNNIDNSYPTTDEKSCPIYFYRIFLQNPTLSNGQEVNPVDNWNDFSWVHYFTGTPLVPGIVGGEAGLSYARGQITSGQLVYDRDSGEVADETAWSMVRSFVSGNVDKSGELCPYCVEGSAQVNDGGEGGVVVIGEDDDDDDDDDSVTDDTSSTPPPKDKTYTLVVTNRAGGAIAVNGGQLDEVRASRGMVQDRNEFHLIVNFMTNQFVPGFRLPLEISGTNVTYSIGQIFEQNEEPRQWGVTLDVTITEESEDGNYRGDIVFDGGSSGDDDDDDDDSDDEEVVIDVEVDSYGVTDVTSSTSTTSSTTPWWPRIIINPDGDPLTAEGIITTSTTPGIWDFQTFLVDDGVTDPPWCCFIAGTPITMADGSFKNIEDVKIGDEVKTHNGVNVVTEISRPLLGNRKLHDVNNTGKYFATEDHMFMTTDGWKCLNVELQHQNYPHLCHLVTGQLDTTDTIITDTGSVKVDSLDISPVNDPNTQLYDLTVNEDHTFFANGLLVHNSWCTWVSSTTTPGNGTTTPGFTTLFDPPTGCIEPPIVTINDTTTTVDPEIPTTTLPPNEQCVYPAPILPLAPNFYIMVDILNLTTQEPESATTQEPETATTQEPEDPGAIKVGDVICDTNEDCNKLNY